MAVKTKKASTKARAIKFTNAELAGIRRARSEFEDMGQRPLASQIYDTYSNYGVSSGRTMASIYAAVRRVDKQIKAETAGVPEATGG